MKSLQGDENYVDWRYSPRASAKRGMTWCDSKANGKVRMEEGISLFSDRASLSGGVFMDMEKLPSFLALLFLFLLSLCTFSLQRKESGKLTQIRVSSIATSGVFGALSALLYAVPIFTIKLPFFPEFLTLHFDEVPALMAGLSQGPICMVLVLLAKTIIKLPLSSTAMVGEWADFTLSLLFLLPVCLLFRKKKTFRSLLFGFLLGIPLHLVAAMVLNVYVLIPFYSFFYGLPLDSLLALCQKAIPWIESVSWSYALWAVLPFNALKDAIVLVLSFSLYKGLKYFLQKGGFNG